MQYFHPSSVHTTELADTQNDGRRRTSLITHSGVKVVDQNTSGLPPRAMERGGLAQNSDVLVMQRREILI